jgi:hypothetical protein
MPRPGTGRRGDPSSQMGLVLLHLLNLEGKGKMRQAV